MRKTKKTPHSDTKTAPPPMTTDDDTKTTFTSVNPRVRKTKKTPHSDTIAPPPKTNDNDKKTMLTSDNASTPPTLPPTLHATSMCYCEQLAGGTFKTEQAMELVDDLAFLPTRKWKKKKTPHSDDSFAFSTIAPPPKTNDNDKKTTLTTDNASTPPTLPPTVHATSMCYCEQLAGGTFKTEQAMELVDDLASLPTRKWKKKKTPHSDDLYAF